MVIAIPHLHTFLQPQEPEDDFPSREQNVASRPPKPLRGLHLLERYNILSKVPDKIESLE